MDTVKGIRRRFAAWIAGRGANENDISVLEVKALYDAAYAERERAQGSMRRYRGLLARAQALDSAYRAQLAAHQARLLGKAV